MIQNVNSLSESIVRKYLSSLINHFFKILPIKESEEETLSVYLENLKIELLGFKELVQFIKEDPSFITLLSILQYLIDNPECPVKTVKRVVFQSISIIKKLLDKYCDSHNEGGDEI